MLLEINTLNLLYSFHYFQTINQEAMKKLFLLLIMVMAIAFAVHSITVTSTVMNKGSTGPNIMLSVQLLPMTGNVTGNLTAVTAEAWVQQNSSVNSGLNEEAVLVNEIVMKLTGNDCSRSFNTVACCIYIIPPVVVVGNSSEVTKAPDFVWMTSTDVSSYSALQMPPNDYWIQCRKSFNFVSSFSMTATEVFNGPTAVVLKKPFKLNSFGKVTGNLARN